MRGLDLFCGAGGAHKGYMDTGLFDEMVGVDIKPQPHYPGEFIQADAMTFPLEGFDFIHASPPCQYWSQMTRCRPGLAETFPRLIAPMRERLQKLDVPWVLENVVNAPLIDPIMLCGTSFGLMVKRHRLFEASFPLTGLPCEHGILPGGYVMNPNNTDGRRRLVTVFGATTPIRKIWIRELGVPWMSLGEAEEAIPPVFTQYIGTQAQGAGHTHSCCAEACSEEGSGKTS